MTPDALKVLSTPVERKLRWKDNPNYSREYYELNTQRVRDKARQWRKANPEAVKAQKQRYWKKHGERVGLQSLCRKHGITVEHFHKLLHSQGGKCAICHNAYSKRLRIDHCHRSGTVRGLLCDNCNVAIGMLKENPATLCSAVDYLTPKLAVILAA